MMHAKKDRGRRDVMMNTSAREKESVRARETRKAVREACARARGGRHACSRARAPLGIGCPQTNVLVRISRRPKTPVFAIPGNSWKIGKFRHSPVSFPEIPGNSWKFPEVPF
jgi:hypothetical protein